MRVAHEIPTLSRKEKLVLDLLVSNGEMYGLEMVKASSGLKRGTVYVTLGRMADKGYVDSRLVEPPGGGPSRRLFRATGLGQRVYQVWEFARGALAEGAMP